METKTTLSIGQIFRKAGRKALGGGLPGAVAGVVQVLTLMWLRTIINYQSRYGASFRRAVNILYKEGGIGRFYRGVGFALFQAPMSKFVATASNDGVLAFLSSFPLSKHWNPAVTTIFASLFVGGFRMFLMPIDTCKTVLQVDSREGFRALMRRVRAGKISALYQGALATAASSTIGHYPWFVTFNFFIGLTSSVISDTIVNVFRVIKTTKQSIGSKHDFTYSDTIRMIVAADGWKGLFGRGLRTRVLANSIQSTLFTVIWRGLAERWGNDDDEIENDATNDNSIESDITTTDEVKIHNLRKPSNPVDKDFVEEK
ncbi:mitochondrial carrier [Fragilariopsis cylindrus CCMP1102]|uniref:Mitochondrial carrier n=1 Tax=Fragilariopsis cylindrus CCMP1102 TaxID=635003 RepID=A0A1E7FF88_9STRA|nr:mitochondrial carrier [Fragilariopsis cylindrus CCMP1102]|eukprot:OEU16839.1 mitochondrial carrier [Fragilariopsis cylindrus CCMP1102]